MNAYIFFTYAITGLGGAQQHIKNKLMYLKETGFYVDVYSCIENKISIEEFNEYADHIYPELKYNPNILRTKDRDRIVNSIYDRFYGKYETIYIESSGGNESLWAELIASKLRCKHLCFNLNEVNSTNKSSAKTDFFSFKYDREELYTINRNFIRHLINREIAPETADRYAFRANCTNVVDESLADYRVECEKADYNIAGIWRTGKEGFVETFENLTDFIEIHNDKTFNVFIIGSGDEDNERTVKEHLSRYSNVSSYFLGYQYPIPLGMILQMDVFISTAGSSRIPIEYSIPSITVTTVNNGNEKGFVPIGILDYTTTSTVYPDSNSNYTLRELLEMVLIDKYCLSHDKLGVAKKHSNKDVESEYKRELNAFIQSSNEISYFDISKILPRSRKEKGYKLIARLFGIALLRRSDRLGHKIKRSGGHKNS